MGRPELSGKIMNASPDASGPNRVPDSGVEKNSFGDRTKFPKDKEVLSRDTMGNKSLIESCPKGSDKGVDKSFLAKAKNDMTKTGSL